MTRPLPSHAAYRGTRANLRDGSRSEIFLTMKERSNLCRREAPKNQDNRSIVRESFCLLLPHHSDELIIVAPLVGQFAASCFLDGTAKSLR